MNTKHQSVFILIIGCVFSSMTLSAQILYKLPCASEGNTIELSVVNPSAQALNGVTIRVTSTPSWIKFLESEKRVGMLKTGQEEKVLFSFSVDKSAPINEEQIITFCINSNTGESHQTSGGPSWKKEIRISVNAPDHFELFQNYPNPFNPITTIRYQVPLLSHIKLTIFNMLGQEVVTLADEVKTAGSYQELFDGQNFSSGVYFYRLLLTDEHGAGHRSQKTMLLLK